MEGLGVVHAGREKESDFGTEGWIWCCTVLEMQILSA